ncbi:MAG: outer membrane beta-barrel protein [Bdellovibrionales bacterium]
MISRFVSAAAVSFFFLSPAFAIDEHEVRLGVQAGHVGLQQDVGSRYGNALGFGVFGNYTTSSEMQFEIGYLSSSHNGLRHQEISTGLNFYFNSYDAAYFSALAGVDFIGHDLPTERATSSGFGLYTGLGVDFELGKRFNAGLQGKYHWAFDTEVTDPSGQRLKGIQSFVTVLLRVMYVFDNKD